LIRRGSLRSFKRERERERERKREREKDREREREREKERERERERKRDRETERQREKGRESTFLYEIIFRWKNPCHIHNPEFGDVYLILNFNGDTSNGSGSTKI